MFRREQILGLSWRNTEHLFLHADLGFVRIKA